jgi:hypothetical protein
MDTGREEVRTWIQAQMASGEISAEPELHMGSKDGGGAAEWEGEKMKKTSGGKKAEATMEVDQEDAFFGDDDDDEEGSDDS